MDCGCILRNTVVTTYDGPFDLAGKALSKWLEKELARHKCPKSKDAGSQAPSAKPAGESESTGAKGATE